LESQENPGTDLVLVYKDQLSVETIKVIDEFPLDLKTLDFSLVVFN